MQKTPDGAMYLQQGGAPEMWAATITRTAQQNWPVRRGRARRMRLGGGRRRYRRERPRHLSCARCAGLRPDRDGAAGGQDPGLLRHHDAAAAAPRDDRPQPGPGATTSSHRPPGDRSMGICRYAEGWISCDTDNDHKAELIHVHMLGNATKTDPVGTLRRNPAGVLHAIPGARAADRLQPGRHGDGPAAGRKPRVMRATLDSLAQSMFPRTVVTLGQVNLADARQTAIGSIIRTTQAGAVTELVKPFTGEAALDVMQALEAIRESRTGITRASQGLTVDELQSTAPMAVSAADHRPHRTGST